MSGNSISTVLMGPPGSGKTTMAALTPVRKPVHVLDVDRKMAAQQNLRGALARKELTFWELQETLVEEPLSARVQRIMKGEKPAVQPRGWLEFAKLVEKLDIAPEAKAAGTWVLDSGTRVGEHLKRLILYTDEKGGSVLSPRDWGGYLNMWEETIVRIIDGAKAADKDLIITVHERDSELPTKSTKSVKALDVKGNVVREKIGEFDLKIAPSIEGQFGLKMLGYVNEAYGLYVEVDRDGEPHWLCRVQPDGKRDLRTSFPVERSIYPPDFSVIWAAGKEMILA